MVLRPDQLRLEKVVPYGEPTVLAELRTRTKVLAGKSFQELFELPEDAVDPMEIEGVEAIFRTSREERGDGQHHPQHPQAPSGSQHFTLAPSNIRLMTVRWRSWTG